MLGQVLIKSPRTGSRTSVGVERDEERFESISLIESTVACPACETVHKWSKDQAISYGLVGCDHPAATGELGRARLRPTQIRSAATELSRWREYELSEP
jgi:hypothetical protein